jgi:hypothetical protein
MKANLHPNLVGTGANLHFNIVGMGANGYYLSSSQNSGACQELSAHGLQSISYVGSGSMVRCELKK